MGTNYYLTEPACPTCGRQDELHIGKSSAGWCFSLHIIPERGINTLDDWRTLWDKPGWTISDEYGQKTSTEQIEDVITERAWPKGSDWSAQDYEANRAEPGPNGLVRNRIGDSFCAGHGEGTWDYCLGEFS